MLYVNLHSAICQLYIDKTERKKTDRCYKHLFYSSLSKSLIVNVLILNAKIS